MRKRNLYQRAGIPEYWIVDVEAQLVDRWTPADECGESHARRITWSPTGAHEPLHIDLAAYFTNVLGTPPID